jgi:hypothetical protein
MRSYASAARHLVLLVVALVLVGFSAERSVHAANEQLSFRVIPVGSYQAGATRLRMRVEVQNRSATNVFLGFTAAGASGNGLVKSLAYMYTDLGRDGELGEGSSRSYAVSVVDAESGGCSELQHRFMLRPKQGFSILVEIPDLQTNGKANFSRPGPVKLLVGLRVKILGDDFECVPDGKDVDHSAEINLRVR